MSQIPRTQFAIKKRPNPMPMVAIPAEFEQQKVKKSTNGSSNGNGHKNGNFDNDVVIIEDECFAIVGHEEVVASTVVVTSISSVEELSPSKKKRSRKSKDSTESKDSDIAKKIEETAAKSAEKVFKNMSKEEEAVKPVLLNEAEAVTASEFKILKMTEGLPNASKRRSDRLTNASTIVNLSTMSTSDQSTKIMSDETLDTSTVERRVGGRRSTRPIDDIKFTYRTPNTDDSFNGTTNATIGSNESLLTTPGTDRKRRPFTDSAENIESPKRSRMDLSGLFSSFSSPVTLLRNKFRRTNIASTPVVGLEAPLKEFVDMDNSDSQLKEVDLNEKSEEVAEVAGDEELEVITTPVKKTRCAIM